MILKQYRYVSYFYLFYRPPTGNIFVLVWNLLRKGEIYKFLSFRVSLNPEQQNHSLLNLLLNVGIFWIRILVNFRIWDYFLNSLHLYLVLLFHLVNVWMSLAGFRSSPFLFDQCWVPSNKKASTKNLNFQSYRNISNSFSNLRHF